MKAAIEAAVRAWLIAAGVSGGVPNPDRAVVLADKDGPRPPLPYLVVRVVVYDIPVHEDEDLVDDSDPPTWRGRGQRTSTVSINAFGAGADAWLERASLMLRAPSILAQLTAAAIVVRPAGGLNNLSALRDSGTEARFQRDYSVDYTREGSVPDDTEDVTELELVVHEDTWQGSPDDLIETVTEAL